MCENHNQFVHLHCHSEFSLLDGLSRVKDLVSRAAELDQPAIALTDHGTMYGTMPFYRAAKAAGVKPIIGVETYFGRITGNDRVIDALATLAFEYPPRAKFFRNELVQFLILAREEELDPTVPTGSYAGAMGRPQFMPSSFRAYAVDSTGDSKRDIWNNWADVSGSIANYFLAHGWRNDEQVAAQATLGSKWSDAVPQPKNTLKVSNTVESLSKKGVIFATDLCADSEGELLTYEGDAGIEHWFGFHNFFVITKYNHSVMYALADHQLRRDEVLATCSGTFPRYT